MNVKEGEPNTLLGQKAVEDFEDLKEEITRRLTTKKTPEKRRIEFRNALALLFVLETDANTQELINLKFSDVKNDGQKPTVTLTNKAMRHRQIPIMASLAKAVSTYGRERKATGDEYVFTNPRTNAGFTTSEGFSTAIRDYIENVLKKRVSLQELRETYGRRVHINPQNSH